MGPTPPPMQLIIVVMSMRVGSTWFTETYLKQHPQVHLVRGEMCHGMEESCTVKQLKGALAECMEAQEKKETITHCAFKAPHWFWGTNTSDARFIANAQFCSQQGVQVIHLYRRNVLKQAVSLCQAERSHVWGVYVPTGVSKTGPSAALAASGTKPVRLAANTVLHAFLFFLADWQKSCRFVNKVLPGTHHRGRYAPPVFELAYEDMSALPRRRATLARVYDFLGIEARQFEAFHEARERQSSSEDGPLNLTEIMLPGEDVRLKQLLNSEQYTYMTEAYKPLTVGLSDDAFTGSVMGTIGNEAGLGELGRC